MIAPLLQIVPTGVEVPQAEALIFTSEQAVGPVVASTPALGRLAYCVGERTAVAAREAGFEAVIGPGDAAALCALIIAHHRGGALVHARGKERAFALAEALNLAGIETKDTVVYHQEPCALTAQAEALLHAAGPVLVPVFSPNAGRRVVQAAKGALAPLHLAAISQAAAEACAGLAVERVEIAPKPNAQGVLAALERLIERGSG